MFSRTRWKSLAPALLHAVDQTEVTGFSALIVMFRFLSVSQVGGKLETRGRGRGGDVKAEWLGLVVPGVLTSGLSLQGPSVEKRRLANLRWPDAASSEAISSTPLIRACTALQEAAVTSWLGTARNTPSPSSVSPAWEGRNPEQGPLSSALACGGHGAWGSFLF